MNIPQKFIEMVEEDIHLIDKSMNQSPDERLELFRQLHGKYQSCIVDWANSMWGFNPKDHTIYLDNIGDLSVNENLKLAKAKLTTFKFGMNAVSLPDVPTNQINIQNNNVIKVNITFDEVRSQVNDMTSLNEEETNELLERIDELEKIVNSKDKKKTKWQKVAPILKWLADKSFDAAMIILPLILKLQEQ